MSETPVPLAEHPWIHVRYGRAILRLHVLEVQAALRRYKHYHRAVTQAAREAARQAQQEGRPCP